MNDHTDDSNSGIPETLDFSISDTFTQHTEIASRGYCMIYRAMRHGRWFVLKGLSPEHRHDPLYMALLEKEYSVMATLDHPNIVHLYGHETDGVAGPCIVMEYVDGRTLADYLNEKPSPAERRRIVIQMLDAMTYYHARQLVHRDLKPSNILVTHNGNNIKIIDFGLADADDYAVLKEPAYTEGYAAPEQRAPGAVVDCRTDLYAFGILLGQIFPHRYRHIARRCARHTPELRYSSAADVKRVFEYGRILPYLFVGIAVFGGLLGWILTVNHNRPSIAEESKSYADSVVQGDTVVCGDAIVQYDTDISPVDSQPVRVLHVKEATAELQQYADGCYSIFLHNIDNGKITTEDAAYQYEAAVYSRVQNRLYKLLIKYKPRDNKEWQQYNEPMQEILHQSRERADSHIKDAHLPLLRDFPDDSLKASEYQQAKAENDKEQAVFLQIVKQYNTEVLNNMSN